VQLATRVEPVELFEQYLYVSSASTTLTGHLTSLANAIATKLAPAVGDRSLDIGSNDGTLAGEMLKRGYVAHGIDPAKNLAPMARSKGVIVEEAYFNQRVADEWVSQFGQARVVTATNSFPHIPDLEGYLRGIRTVLSLGGVFVIEAHYLPDLVEQSAFDTVYHEHYHYWRLETIESAIAPYGLEVVDAERLPVHHGQLRVWIRHCGVETTSARARAIREAEQANGYGQRSVYDVLARRTERIRRELRWLLDDLRMAGRRVAGYGAPAKASTLAAWCGLGPSDLLWIADRNPLKQGRFTPGTGIPIVDPARIEQDSPDVLLLFAWNFAGEVMDQLSGFRARGGRFLIPVPEVRLV
jgi:SAM-dependent methyltransferase